MTDRFLRDRREAFLSARLFLLLAIAIYSPALVPGRTFVADVLFRYFLGSYDLLKQALAAGELPFWNPYLSSGIPALANAQSSVFYPPTYLFTLLPFGLALKLHIVFHAILSGFFMTLLAARLRLSPWSARLSGIVYAFNGFAVFHFQLLTHLQVYTWIPLLAYIFCRAAADRSRRTLATGAVILAILIFSGYIPFMIYAILIAGSLALITSERPVMESGRQIGIVILLGMTLAAVQIVPTLQFALESSRAASSGQAWVFEKSTAWKEIVRMTFYPLWNWYLHPDVDVSVGGFYWGLPVLLLGVAAMQTFRRSRLCRLLAGMFLLGLALSAGEHGLLYPLLARFVWPFGWLRYPPNAMLLSSFALALLAGLGLERFGRRASPAWVILCVLDLGLFAQRAYETIDSSFYSVRPPTVAFLSDRRPEGRLYMTPPSAALLSRRGKSRYDAFVNFADSVIPNYAMFFHLRDAAGGTELQLDRYHHILAEISRSAHSPWLNVVGARYILSFWDLPNLPTLWQGPSGIKVAENKGALPRAYFTTCAVWEPAEQTVAHISNGTRRPFSCAVLNDPPAAPTSSPASSGRAVPVEDLSPNHLRLHVHASQPGWVVLSDSFDPGWRVTANAAQVPVYRANYVQQAVAVATGDSILEWRYRPPNWGLSIAESLLALLLILSMLRRKRPHAAAPLHLA